jgi:hypothetical protein
MAIEIRDAALEARIHKYLEASGSNTVEELLLRLLDSQEEQDKWLLENREFFREKIKRGAAQLDRGEGIPGDQFAQYLEERKRKAK